MSNEEVRMRLYRINVNTKAIRKLMKNAIQAAGQGNLEGARSLFEKAEAEFDVLKEEHQTLKNELQCNSDYLQEQEGSIEFTEIMRDTVLQAAQYADCTCSPIRFHVYG